MVEENNYFSNSNVYANISCNLLNNRTLHKITFLWITHVLERLHLNENAWAGLLVTLCDSSKVNFQQGFFWGGVCAQNPWWVSTSNAGTRPCRNGNNIPAICTTSTLWQFHSVYTPPHISTCLRLLELRRNKLHKKSWPLETQHTSPSTQALKTSAVLSPPARAPGGWGVLIPAAACASLEPGLEEWPGRVQAGNCSGSLALSSRYPSGLPAMMTALLPLNCLTEHEGWLQLAPVQGRARRACTTKISESSAIDSEGCSTKSLGAAPCISNLRNSLWFALRAIRERYIVLCLELKMLVSNTNPKLNHWMHLIFFYG